MLCLSIRLLLAQADEQSGNRQAPHNTVTTITNNRQSDHGDCMQTYDVYKIPAVLFADGQRHAGANGQ